jgi:hypothetical protein
LPEAAGAGAARGELVGTLLVNIDGSATNATQISGAALTPVGGIAGTSTVARATMRPSTR